MKYGLVIIGLVASLSAFSAESYLDSDSKQSAVNCLSQLEEQMTTKHSSLVAEFSRLKAEDPKYNFVCNIKRAELFERTGGFVGFGSVGFFDISCSGSYSKAEPSQFRSISRYRYLVSNKSCEIKVED